MSVLLKTVAICGLLTASALIGCSDGPKEKGVTIALKFPVNSEYVYSMTTLQTIKQQMAGMNSEISQHMQLQSSYKVTGAEKGNRTLTVSYEHLYVKSSSNGMLLEYDSRDSAKQPAELRGINNIIHRPFSIVVNEMGKVLKVENSAKTDSTAAAAGAGQITDTSIMQMMEQSLNVYPEKPVRPGESWRRSYATNVGFMDMQIVSDYKLMSVANGMAHLEVNAVIKSLASKAPGVKSMRIEMEGSQRGSLDIDIRTGLIQDSRFTQDISGKMLIPGAEIPMKLTSETRIMGRMR